MEPSQSKIVHTCPSCLKPFQVLLNVEILKIHRAACPFCGHSSVFDNRNGKYRSSSFSAEGSPRATERMAGGMFRPVGEFGRNRSDPANRSSSQKKGRQSNSKGSSARGWNFTTSSDRRRNLFNFSFPSIFSDRGLSGPGFDYRKILLPLFFVATIFILGFLILFISNMFVDEQPYLDQIVSTDANRIYDRNGELLSELVSSQMGSLTYEEIPDQMKDILIFIEDQAFYSHGGIHLPSIGRAMLRNVASFRYSQGGSTITQQTARILMDRREKTMFRKVREAGLARRLESRFSKAEILTMYMNQVYLGHGATGIESAARFYFRKSLAELDFVEMMMLASLPSAPNRLSPLRNPRLLEAKLDVIFERMIDENFTDLSREDFEQRKSNIFRSLNRSPSETVFGDRINDAPYVAEYIRLQIIDILGEDSQFSAGLRIETTLDARLQRAAARESLAHIQHVASSYPAVRRTNDGQVIRDDSPEAQIQREYSDTGILPFVFGMPSPEATRPSLQTASIGINPHTGEVLFMQGGTEFSSGNQLNRSINMHRQTGSAIKPVVYSAGIEDGIITAATMIDDTPIFVSQAPQTDDDPGYWLPGNITGVYEGFVPARRALAQSKNIPAIQVGRMVGINRLSEQFRKFFYFRESDFDRRFRYDDTVAIGTLEMSPFEMALAFGAFGNNGIIRRPYMITRIIGPSGTVLFDGVEKDEFNLGIDVEQRVIPGDVAHVMASILADAARYGGTSRGGFASDRLIGKTGTTNNYRDAWFTGVVPGLSVSVWVGYDNPSYSMNRGTGAVLAGPLFGRIVGNGYPDIEGEFEFEPAARSISVCQDSGKIPTAQCPDRVSELFTLNTGPADSCDIHTEIEDDDYIPGDFTRDSDFE